MTDSSQFLVFGGTLNDGQNQTIQLIDTTKGTYRSGKTHVLNFFTNIYLLYLHISFLLTHRVFPKATSFLGLF